MKIAILTDKLSIGGGCEYIYQLAKNMPQHTFVIFATGGDFPLLTDLPNVLQFIPGRISAGKINAQNPDIVHSNHLKTLLAVGIGLKAPLVHTVHGVHLRKYEFKRGLKNKLLFFLRSKLEKYLYSCCSKLIVLTNSDKEFLQKRLKVKTPIEIIPNGICYTEASEEKLDWDYIFIGRYDFPKGCDILIKAIASQAQILRQKNRIIHLVGDGKEKENIRSLIRQYDIGDIAVEKGAIQNAGRKMSSGATVIMPSRWEGLPFLALEAGIKKCFLIGADVPGIKDIIDHEQNGILFPCEDHVTLGKILAADYPEDIKKSFQNNLHKKITEKFNIQQMLEKTEKVYNDCLK